MRQSAACSIPETRNQRQVEIKDILQPFDRGRGLVGQDLDEFWASLVSGGFEGVIVEGLDAVLDAKVDLCAGEGAVDPGGSFGGITTEEVLGKVSSEMCCLVYVRAWNAWVYRIQGRAYFACRERAHYHR